MDKFDHVKDRVKGILDSARDALYVIRLDRVRDLPYGYNQTDFFGIARICSVPNQNNIPEQISEQFRDLLAANKALFERIEKSNTLVEKYIDTVRKAARDLQERVEKDLFEIAAKSSDQIIILGEDPVRILTDLENTVDMRLKDFSLTVAGMVKGALESYLKGMKE